MAAAPSIGRAAAVEAPPSAREAELTQALYERYSHQLYGFCFAKLGSREEAEDAVQTTFLNAFRALERGVVPQAESAWLFKIAENVCLSRHRSSFRRRRVESPSDLEVLQDVVPAREHGGDELVGLERVLEQMPESQRRAILLREWQGLSYREIADEMELTQAAVETLIFRARRSLAQGLESLDEPQRKPHRRRVRRGADVGGLIAALKTFLGTAAGMKAAATVVAVGSATVIAVTPPSIRHELAGAVRQAVKPAPAVIHHHPAAAAPASAAGAAPVAPAVARAASPTRRFAPTLLASRRTAAPAHPATAVEGVGAAPTAAAAPALSAAAPVAVVPAVAVAVVSAAPAPVDVAPVSQSQPVQAPAPAPAVVPHDGAPAPPAEQQQQPVLSAPSKEQGHDNGTKDQTARAGSPPGRGNSADNGHGGQKEDVRSIAIASGPAVTTSTNTTTGPAAPPAAPAATTTEAAAPAPPADRGHRGDGTGGGSGNGDGNGNGNGNGSDHQH